MTKAGNSQIMRTITLLITIFSLSLPAYAKYSGGIGEPNDPYQIATAEDLMLLGDSPEDYDKHFILTADIDLNPNLPGRKVFDKAVIAPDRAGSHPIEPPFWGRFAGTPFAGVFRGNQHKIANLVVAGSKSVGLFGGLGPEAEVSDLGVVNVNANSSYGPVGALAGYNLGYVNRCYCTGEVHAYAQVGGLVGGNGGTVTASYSTASVSGSWAGGLVGGNEGGCVTHSYSAGAVDGEAFVGGLVAINSNGIVLGCYSTAAVRSSYGSFGAGGLVGSNSGVVSISYSTGAVRASGRFSRVGGLVGHNHRDVTQCYATGAVSGGTDGEIGGVVGRAEYGSSVTSSFWDVQTSGTTRMGGRASSSDEYGKLTAQMRDVRLYLEAGWDFVGESPNGLHEAWQMPEGGGYPVLAIFNGYTPPSLRGSGTRQDPHIISSALELGAMIHHYPDAHYRLAEPIVLSGVRWSMAVMPLLGGTFDGNGLTISDLTIRGHSRLGLLGRIESGAQVTDLGVVDVNVIGSGMYVGALVGQNNGDVRRCYSSGIVRGESSIGGLVGDNWYGSISTSYSTGTVSGDSYVGGLVGLSSGRVTDCYARGAANGEEAVGGLVGSAGSGGIVVRCYSTAVVGGNDDVGGLVGDVGYRKAGVLAGIWDMETSGQSGSDGGVGLTTAEMMDPYMLGLNGFSNDPNWVLDPGRDYPRLAWEGTPGDIIHEPEIDWLEGSGSAESPYRIDSPEQLIMLGKASILWDRSFVLCADINLDPNLPNVPVFGQAVIPVFTGVFDGGGHTISHLTIQGGNYLGLFGQIEAPAEVRYLALGDVNVVGRGDDIGSLAGSNTGMVIRCSSTGAVKGVDHVGGLVGNNAISRYGQPDIPGTIAQCFSTAVVSGTYNVGGLVGDNPSLTGHIACSYSDGRVSGDSAVGGFVGRNGGYVTECYSRGSATGVSCVGGLVGSNTGFYVAEDWNGDVTTCYSTGSVTCADIGGGLVGESYAGVEACFWDTQISGQTTSAGGTGKTTAEMQTAKTFLDAGWDFVGETANGTEDIWWILEGQDYPRLWWEADNN
ncbi:MAG TPA: GLUG motif-containing protein [Sedimentisphaerales bacterium]|nr:GLUG motif-containing protein [Sedimentisphaerales bacterium]